MFELYSKFKVAVDRSSSRSCKSVDASYWHLQNKEGKVVCMKQMSWVRECNLLGAYFCSRLCGIMMRFAEIWTVDHTYKFLQNIEYHWANSWPIIITIFLILAPSEGHLKYIHLFMCTFSLVNFEYRHIKGWMGTAKILIFRWSLSV